MIIYNNYIYYTYHAKEEFSEKDKFKVWRGLYGEMLEQIHRALGAGTFSRKFAGVISNQIY